MHARMRAVRTRALTKGAPVKRTSLAFSRLTPRQHCFGSCPADFLCAPFVSRDEEQSEPAELKCAGGFGLLDTTIRGTYRVEQSYTQGRVSSLGLLGDIVMEDEFHFLSGGRTPAIEGLAKVDFLDFVFFPFSANQVQQTTRVQACLPIGYLCQTVQDTSCAACYKYEINNDFFVFAGTTEKEGGPHLSFAGEQILDHRSQCTLIPPSQAVGHDPVEDDASELDRDMQGYFGNCALLDRRDFKDTTP